MININLTVTDIPKEKIQKHANGKSYLNLVCDKKKEVDKFGYTHTVYISQTKEERAAKVPKIYVGSGKEIVFNKQPTTTQTHAKVTTVEVEDIDDSDLPF